MIKIDRIQQDSTNTEVRRALTKGRCDRSTMMKCEKNRKKKAASIALLFLMLLTLALPGGFFLGNGNMPTAYAATTPAKVTGFTASQTGQTTVTLKWKKVSGATGYKIYRATGATGSFKLLKAVTSGTTVKYKNSGLPVGKTYRYKIRAYKGTSAKPTYGSYSAEKTVKIMHYRPKFSTYLPTTIDSANRTIVITLTNNSNSDTMYVDGFFALEENKDSSGKIHDVSHVSYEKPELGLKGTLKTGSRLLIRPGEKVRLTGRLDKAFAYDRNAARLTVCVRYRQRDYVTVYTVSGGNAHLTPAEYQDFLAGGGF